MTSLAVVVVRKRAVSANRQGRPSIPTAPTDCDVVISQRQFFSTHNHHHGLFTAE
jgi:hypothetical protein